MPTRLEGAMPRSYRRFSREFKMQIVESILKGAVASQVAKANDLHSEVVRKWVRDFKAYQKDVFAGRGKAYTDNAKIGNTSSAKWPPKTWC
ncbi:MAG: transposase [Candidatus Baltobacteraceae bacterium]